MDAIDGFRVWMLEVGSWYERERWVQGIDAKCGFRA